MGHAYWNPVLYPAVSASEPGIVARLAIDAAFRAVHFDLTSGGFLTTDKAQELRSILNLAVEFYRDGTGRAELEARVDALWESTQPSYYGLTSGVYAVGHAASVWEATSERLFSAKGSLVSVMGDGRKPPREVRKHHSDFHDDNEERWLTRRLGELETLYLEERLWTTFDDAGFADNAQLAFDPTDWVTTTLESERKLPARRRRSMVGRLIANSDNGWFLELDSGVVVTADGDEELPDNVDYTVVVADEGQRAPFRIR